jgi:uncharacterized protein YjbI with pentapeptide repeats
MYRADLTSANLSGACLSGADLTDAKLDGVQLSRAVYDARTRWPGEFRPEDHGAMLVERRE